MPVCQGCGASYENSFSFCPHCGRAKAEPQKIIVEHVASDRITRKDVIAMLSGNAKYRLEVVKRNMMGDETSRPRFRANLEGVDFSGLDLSGLNLSGVNFRGSNFEGTNLSGCDMRDALVSCANFKGAILREADLSRTNFIESNLTGADLSKANVSQTYFKSANLTGANLSEAYYVERMPVYGDAVIEKAQIKQVKNMSTSLLGRLFG